MQILTHRDTDTLIDYISEIIGFEPLKKFQSANLLLEFNGQVDEYERLKSLFYNLWLPDILPEEIKEDLSELFVYNIAPADDKQVILKKWEEKRKGTPLPRRFEDETVYFGYPELLWFNDVSDGKFLPIFLQKIKGIEKYLPTNKKLSLDETHRYINTIAFNWKNKLTLNDLKILLCLRNPKLLIKGIATKTGLNIKTVSSRLDYLKRKFLLGVYGQINYGKLGLRRIIVNTKENLEKRFEEKFNSELPYLRTRYLLRAGSSINSYMFQIPSGEDSINYFYRLLMDNFEITDFYIVTEFKYNLSMRLFDIEKQEWDLRWENWAIWLKTFLYEQEYEVLFPEGIKDDDKKIDFDLTDLEIITVLSSDMRMSYDEISRRLKKPKTTLYHKAKRILDSQVLFPFVHLAQIGLNENIVIEYTGKEDFVKALESALFEMPKVYIYRFESFYGKKGIRAWLELPDGSIGRLDKILTNYFDDKDLWLASTLWLSSVLRDVPLNRFNNKTKKWVPIRELLNNS